MICSAAFIWAFKDGLLSCDMFVLPLGTMFLPLNTGSIMLWVSKKSGPQPRFGQIATLAFGTSQNFDSMVACGTSRRVNLMPICASWDSTASAVFDAGGVLSAIDSNGAPVYLPLGYPAFFIYDSASATLPFGLA